MKNKHNMIPGPGSFLRSITTSFIAITALYNGAAFTQSMPALPPNQLQLPAHQFTLNLKWLGDSINGKWEPHTALLIPVKLFNCPKQFYMQFDLGSPYSLFYKNKLAGIRSKYPRTIAASQSPGKLENFSFKSGTTKIVAKEIIVKQFDSLAIDWNRNSIEIIGTLGSDLIDGKTVVIDYPKQQLTIAPSVPGKLGQQVLMNDLIYTNRQLLIPATILGKQSMLYFDTGSSMYELLGDQQTCEALAVPGSVVQQNKVNSWGRLLTANSLASNDSISIGGQWIRLHSTTYMEGINAAQAEQMRKMGIGGMTGNKLFLDYKLIIDTKAKKFGLIKRK